MPFDESSDLLGGIGTARIEGEAKAMGGDRADRGEGVPAAA